MGTAYSDWAAAEDGTGATIRLTLETYDGPVGEAPAAIEVDGRRLRLSGAELEGWADADSLEAVCRVPSGLASRPGVLASEVVDTLLLFLIARSATGDSELGGMGKAAFSLPARNRVSCVNPGASAGNT